MGTGKMTSDDTGYRIEAARDEELDFTQSMLRELARMAQARRDQMLAYMLEMVYVEVSDMIRDMHARKGKSGNLKKVA